MSGILHKAKDAIHPHHGEKASEKNTSTRANQSDNQSHHQSHQSHQKPHLSQEERERLEFNADRGFDHAVKGSHGAGVGFEE
ncbi:hypothetical protein N7492_008102 [Penicillium capsulatum]|uniref:Uncharacterized protein n=1 Tax=Penicillium capsulatum TaxID=69766 RepID=A0A9W9HUK2_9EURO|nr:hypothetical protein N7492_008102 [Penicillium capsulatum]KAJ6105512.1 hypothetical protein N7512_009029 [Penicillium capsulatum]